MIIDAHHHFWRYDPQQYAWIDDAKSVLRRDFLPEHLAAEIAAAGVDGVVSVQARQTIEETDCLLDFADRNEFICGTVGWIPLISPRVADDLAMFSRHKKLKAVRHVLQDEPDDDYMLRADFNDGIGSLARFGLAYDILIFERQLPQAIRLVDRHPSQLFVLDHVAKPRIGEGLLSPWRENIRELARRQNVYCKISGMVTEADWRRWTPKQLRPYYDVVLEVFGPRRLMFGSDWPVCLLACEYRRWKDIVSDYIAALSPAEQQRILGETAIEAYRLASS
jgi:L-fuconolactonase